VGSGLYSCVYRADSIGKVYLLKELRVKLNQDFGMAVETILYLKKKGNADYIQSKEIARELKFSVGYLQKVIQSMSKRGILECKRGRIGGVKIRANVITLLDLWETTCGQLEFTDPPLPLMKKPLKALSDALQQIVIFKYNK
jgi:DNA-binding IscR family transcriptional regulator